MPAVDVWLLGGPAYDRLTPIEVDEGESLPQFTILLQAGAYLGAGDQPSPPVQYRYRRCDGEDDPPTFRYDGPLPPRPVTSARVGDRPKRAAVVEPQHSRHSPSASQRAIPWQPLLEHLYDALVEDVAGRWWNGIWGRDVWLTREVRWKVTARTGDSETGRVLRWEFDTEDEAHAMVKRLLAADAGGQWRAQSGDSQPPQLA